MLTPTHVQVAVLRTKGLIYKGKNGTNDAFIIYSLGKEKFQSSIKEKAAHLHLDWNEGCDMLIPTSNGNKSELVLKVMHKASLGDKFLGRIALTLSDFDVTGKAKPNWYPLLPKVGSEKDTKYRGEIEVRISFLIKSIPANVSTNDLSKKRSGSFKSSLGSILSLGKGKKKKKEKADSKSKNSLAGGSTDSLKNGSNNNLSSSRLNLNNNLPVINDDPGVISEEEDEHEAPLQFKIDRKSSIQSTTETESILSNSVPSTPKTEPKRRLQDIFAESPPASPPEKVVEPKPPKNNDYEDEIDNSHNLSPSPKPRIVRLPSVIVEEPSALSSLTGSNNDNNEPEPPKQVVPGAFATLPRLTSPSKLSVSASMSNLLDPSNNGKGSVRKTIKSMFASSKHLSVDEIFPKNGDEGNIAGSSDGKTKKHGETAQPQFPGGFFMKKRDSLRDLGIPKETYKQYERKSKEELVAVIVSLQTTVSGQKQKIGDLEDYIDKLLLRVLDNAPGLLKSGSSIRLPEVTKE